MGSKALFPPKIILFLAELALFNYISAKDNLFFTIFAAVLMTKIAKTRTMLIGRKKEQQELWRAYEWDESRFVAVYGRRRVGKTYLVRETFKDKIIFSHSGLANQPLKEQLVAWRMSLERAGLEVQETPASWLDAFMLLLKLIEQSTAKKKVVFLDELPWMDTPKSRLVTALEFFWNGWASARNDVLLIVCGSATSWIINKLFRNHGGLYGRISFQIHLYPFTLHECEQYAKELHLSMSRYDLLEAYMVFGGVPYYWSLLEKGKSLAQNIDDLCFAKNGKLRYEYTQLYDSLFHNPDNYLKVVNALGQSPSGMRRDDLIKKLKIADNGNFSRILEDLEHSGLITRYNSYGQKYNGIYRLMDNFSLFYLKFMQENKTDDPAFWSHSYTSSVRLSWCGLAFERICFQHIPQIKQALGISGVVTNTYSWQVKDDPEYGPGAQVDMLIERADNAINICEMKFSSKEYTISKEYDAVLRHKIARFADATKLRKSLRLTMVTTYGIVHNAYWNSVQSEVVADDLFKE